MHEEQEGSYLQMIVLVSARDDHRDAQPPVSHLNRRVIAQQMVVAVKLRHRVHACVHVQAVFTQSWNFVLSIRAVRTHGGKSEKVLRIRLSQEYYLSVGYRCRLAFHLPVSLSEEAAP